MLDLIHDLRYSLSALKLPIFVVGWALPNATPSSRGGTRALRVAPLRVWVIE
ncbi:hypothetical protein NUACC26_058250 [Scytonema sp. NUACC26]